MSKLRLPLVPALALCVIACSGGDAGLSSDAGHGNDAPPGATSASNHLDNPSFENGRAPWFSLVESSPYWMDFTVTETRAHTGSHSAVLDLHSRGEIARGVRVWGVVADLDPEALPRRIAGHYRVETWQRGTARQYVQVALSIEVARNRDPLQLAWILCGIDAAPFSIANRKFVFTGPKEPEQDAWVAFDIDVHEALRREWGVNYPATLAFESVRIFFEARFDRYEESDGPVGGRVYYDDLYFGN